MYASEGMKFGSHPLLDCVEQLHAAYPLQLFRNPVSETCANTHTHSYYYLLPRLLFLLLILFSSFAMSDQSRRLKEKSGGYKFCIMVLYVEHWTMIGFQTICHFINKVCSPAWNSAVFTWDVCSNISWFKGCCDHWWHHQFIILSVAENSANWNTIPACLLYCYWSTILWRKHLKIKNKFQILKYICSLFYAKSSS